MATATTAVRDQYGCYAWVTGDSIRYCGSFSPYNRFPSSLRGRVHNYFQNHSSEARRKNTNLMVFEKINEALVENSVGLMRFQADWVVMGEELVDGREIANNSLLARAVEQFLICYYKSLGQCDWNRE